MKKALSLLLAFVMCLSLCACGGRDENIVATGTKEGSNNQEGIKSSQEKTDNNLLGAWYSDEEGIVLIFTESGEVLSYEIECSYNDNPKVNLFEEKYKTVNRNQLETYNSNNKLNSVYDFNINGDSLFLSLNSSGNDQAYQMTLHRAKKTTQSKDPLVGQWKLLSMGYCESPSYQHWEYDVTFYSDGTFVSKRIDYYTEERTTNSKYSIIHDGNTIEMIFSISSHYWDFEFLCNDVMLVTTENSQLLYIAQ